MSFHFIQRLTKLFLTLSNTFRVTILGSSAALPTQKRASSGQWIECNNRSILVDCGEGTQMQLRKFKIHFQRISHILISHLHGDHFLGLPGLLSSMNLLGRTRDLKIYGPKGLKEVLDVYFQVSDTYLGFKFEIIPICTKDKIIIFEDNAIKIWSFPLAHRIETYGYSFEEKNSKLRIDKSKIAAYPFKPDHFAFLMKGVDFELLDGTKINHKLFTFPPLQERVYSYCSDTKPFNELNSYLHGTTTLYHEATFLESEAERAKKTFHATAMNAAQIAEAIQCKKLLIGHLSSRYESGKAHEEEAKVFFSNTSVVEDGQVYEII